MKRIGEKVKFLAGTIGWPVDVEGVIVRKEGNWFIVEVNHPKIDYAATFKMTEKWLNLTSGYHKSFAGAPRIISEG